MRFWHYTIFPTLRKIFEAGEIKKAMLHIEDGPVVLRFKQFFLGRNSEKGNKGSKNR